jgi:hypothetical protein
MFATYLVARFAGETVLHNFFAKIHCPCACERKEKGKEWIRRV